MKVSCLYIFLYIHTLIERTSNFYQALILKESIMQTIFPVITKAIIRQMAINTEKLKKLREQERAAQKAHASLLRVS